MKILDRYILSEFAKNLAVTLMVLVLVSFIADYLRGVGDEGISPIKLFQYSLYQVPMIFCQMVPPASMLATMVTLSLLNRKNELTAIHAAGISLIHISSLIFGAIFIACCISLVTSDRVVPPLARKKTSFYWKEIKGREDFSLDIKTSKIWYRSKNYLFNLKFYDKKTNTIQGIGIYFFDDAFQLTQHIEAELAHYENEKNEWIFRNGMLTTFSKDSAFPMSRHFDEKRLVLQQTPKEFLDIEKQVETLRLKELRAFIEKNRAAGLDTKAYEVDLHSRIAISFIPLIMGLLAIPYSIRPKRQGGLGKDISVCIGWIMGYWILYSVSLSLGKSGAVAPWASVWLPSLLFFGAALFLVFRGRTA